MREEEKKKTGELKRHSVGELIWDWEGDKYIRHDLEVTF